MALVFLAIFFAIFYLTFLAYKLLQKEKYDIGDIILLMANSFIFYGLGYTILINHQTGGQLLGLFTLFNAIVHFIVSVIIYRQKLADRNLFYLVIGLVLVFITIAIPVQLNGNRVTLLWAGQAALLFWIGRTKNIAFYEKLSYPLMLLALCSITHDWLANYNDYYNGNPESKITPLFNVQFLSSLLFIAAFGFINWVNTNKSYSTAIAPQKGISKLKSLLIPAILLIAIYFAFRLEIENYWHQLYMESEITLTNKNQDYPNYFFNNDLNSFKTIWILNYSLVFVSALAIVNIKKIRSEQLGLLNLALIIVAIAAFLSQGLLAITDLRASYLNQTQPKYYQPGSFNLFIRYVSFAFVALTLVISFKYIRQIFIQKDFTLAFDLMLHTSVLLIASTELIHWMDIAASTQSYKLGLSILWGVYSMLLIMVGIWKQKQHLRIGAIALFGITLVKLFFYDISHLNTIAKTIVFVSLGVLLLIISFLYNKYKHLISNEIKH